MSPRRAYAIALIVPLATPRTTLASSHRSYGSVASSSHRRVLVADLWSRSGVAARGRVAALAARLSGMPPGQSRAPRQELALLDDALAQLVDAHRVDEPLHAGADLVVAVAVVVERAQARLDRRQQVFAGGELLERLRRVRVGAETAGDEHLEAGFDRCRRRACAIDGDDADVVEHRLAAVGGAAGEVDLELAGQALRVRVAQQEVGRSPRPTA